MQYKICGDNIIVIAVSQLKLQNLLNIVFKSSKNLFKYKKITITVVTNQNKKQS